jgi:flagellar biosynthesis/type III secretory pathway M-ring protein FliF/YscJ
MAENSKSTGRALVPKASEPVGPDEFDTALRGVQGKVRKAVVSKLRRLVEQDPEAFVRNMRGWMAEGRTDE